MRALATFLLAAPATGLTTKANNDTLKTRACQPPFNALPYCDITLPLGTRVGDFIERLWANASWIPPQLTARHGGGGSPGPTDAVPELGLPEYDWGLNCIHGVQSNCVEEGGRVYCPTSFMNPVNFGSAWNKSLAFELGSIVATETRALWVAGATEESSWSGRPHVGLDCWSPNININRDPRWGRNQEVPSEDPLLNGDFGEQYTRGIQTGEDARFIKTVVTLKHWDAYSLENSDGFNRHNFDAVVSPYGLATTYFPAFRQSVVNGGAKGVMCSYNSLNGVPTCASPFLRDLLRGGALDDIWRTHKFVPTEGAAACEALVNGTTDVSSDVTYHNALLGCAKAAINAALTNTFTLRFQLGLFDPVEDQPYWRVPLSEVATAHAEDVNLLATLSSMVLLKHDGKTLPLPQGKRVAVVGPHANATSALVGNYLGQLCPDDTLSCVESPFLAISRANAGGVTRLAPGPGLTKNDTRGWAAALAEAAAADAVVLCLGIDGSIEGESNDRTSIDLPAVQHAFAAAVGALGKPTALVLVHGGSLDTTAERDSAAIGAVLDAFYPGIKGAAAIAATLFGHNDHLGGKMPFTTYPAEYTTAIKMSEMELDVGPGRGYRFYTGEPVYPFGRGLSLTTFTLDLAAGPAFTTLNTEAAPSTSVLYTVRVANTGAVSGDEVVQAYFVPISTPSQPASKLKQQLFDYARVHLAPGGTADVHFSVDSATLRLVDRASGDLVSTPGSFKILFTNGNGVEVDAAVTVSGGEVKVKTFPY